MAMEFQNCHMLFVNESRRPYFLLHLMLANNDGAVEQAWVSSAM